MEENEIKDLCRDVEAIAGHDGSGDIRVIVECAAKDGITDPSEIAEIVAEAREDWAHEKAQESS